MSDAPAPLPSEDEPALRVLVYADDPAVRERVRLGIGRRPSRDLSRVDFVDVATAPQVVREVERHRVHLCVLDGEAWPAGGLGLTRQLKDEVLDAPPCLVLLGRRDDLWLATWSGADGSVLHPVDGPALAAEAVRLLRRSAAVEPASG